MMRHFLRKTIVATLVTSIVSCAACKKKDKEDNPIVGKWEATTYHYVYDNTIPSPPQHITKDTVYASGNSLVLELRSDGSYTYTDQTNVTDVVTDGTFIAENSKLVRRESSTGARDTAAYSISGSNTLVLVHTQRSPGTTTQITQEYARMKK